MPFSDFLVINYGFPKTPSYSYEDYRQMGRIGLIQAVDKFDPSAGPKFETFARRRIMGSVIDQIRKDQPGLRRGKELQMVFFDDLLETSLPTLVTTTPLEEIQWLYSAIGKLDVQQRFIIELYYIQNVPIKQIAIYFDRTPTTIHNIKAKALRTLRENIGEPPWVSTQSTTH